MAIAFVQSKSVQSSGATSITTPSMTSTSGNFLVAGGAAPSNVLGGATPVTDSKSNTWQTGWTNTSAGTKNTLSRYAENITGGASHTVTLTPSSSVACALAVAEFSGVALTSSLDKTVHTSSGTNPHDSGPTATTTQANELLVGIGGCTGGAVSTSAIPQSVSSPSIAAFTDIAAIGDGTPQGTILSYAVSSAADTFQYEFSYGGASSEGTGIATFKASSPAFVQVKTASGVSVSSVTSPSFTSTSGNFLLGFGSSFNNTFLSTALTDSKSNTWQNAWLQNGGTNGHAVCNYVENMTGGSGHTVTLTPVGGGSFIQLAVAEFSGVNTSSSIDQTTSAASAADPHLSGRTSATAQAVELIIGGGTNSHSGIAPQSAGFMAGSRVYTDAVALSGASAQGIILSYAIVSATGAFGYIFSNYDTQQDVSGIATFKDAAGGGSSIVARRTLHQFGNRSGARGMA